MSETGYASFDATVDKTNHVLKQIEQTFGWSRQLRKQSYGGLRAVLHALRDRLSVEEGAHLAAQLPILLCGIYYHGWDPSRVPVKMNREEFLQRVQDELAFPLEGDPERLVQAVVEALGAHVTEGEWEKVRASVPRDLATLLAPPVH